MNPKEWQKSLKEYLQQLPLSPEVLEKLYEDLSRRTSRLLEDIAVACEGEKKQIPKTINVDEAFWGNPIKAMLVHEQGINKGLDTAANLIRSLKGDE